MTHSQAASREMSPLSSSRIGTQTSWVCAIVLLSDNMSVQGTYQLAHFNSYADELVLRAPGVNGTYTLAPPPLGTSPNAGNQQRGGQGKPAPASYPAGILGISHFLSQVVLSPQPPQSLLGQAHLYPHQALRKLASRRYATRGRRLPKDSDVSTLPRSTASVRHSCTCGIQCWDLPARTAQLSSGSKSITVWVLCKGTAAW